MGESPGAACGVEAMAAQALRREAEAAQALGPHFSVSRCTELPQDWEGLGKQDPVLARCGWRHRLSDFLVRPHWPVLGGASHRARYKSCAESVRGSHELRM